MVWICARTPWQNSYPITEDCAGRCDRSARDNRTRTASSCSQEWQYQALGGVRGSSTACESSKCIDSHHVIKVTCFNILRILRILLQSLLAHAACLHSFIPSFHPSTQQDLFPSLRIYPPPPSLLLPSWSPAIQPLFICILPPQSQRVSQPSIVCFSGTKKKTNRVFSLVQLHSCIATSSVCREQ